MSELQKILEDDAAFATWRDEALSSWFDEIAVPRHSPRQVTALARALERIARARVVRAIDAKDADWFRRRALFRADGDPENGPAVTVVRRRVLNNIKFGDDMDLRAIY